MSTNVALNSIAQWTKAWALSEGLKLQFDREVTSTNTLAKNDSNPITKPLLERAGDFVSDPTLYLAESQSAGRGRGSNTWISASDALFSTWSFALAFPPQPILSPLIGLALFESASTAFPGLDFSLKAPNDLFLGENKIAGLLIETVMIGSEVTCVVGLGFNAVSAPQDLKAQAIGLGDRLNSSLTESDWVRFLNLWKTNLSLAMKDGRSDLLRMDVRLRLVAALNLHPRHQSAEDRVLEIDEFGQIQTASRKILWHEL